MAPNLTDNWQIAKILTDNWHLLPPIQTLLSAFLFYLPFYQLTIYLPFLVKI